MLAVATTAKAADWCCVGQRVNQSSDEAAHATPMQTDTTIAGAVFGPAGLSIIAGGTNPNTAMTDPIT